MNVPAQLKALIPIIKASNTENITVLNLDNAIMGKFDSVVSMQSKSVVIEKPTVVESRPQPETNPQSKVKSDTKTKKTRGRPVSKKQS
jgi:hypothetical protein